MNNTKLQVLAEVTALSIDAEEDINQFGQMPINITVGKTLGAELDEVLLSRPANS